MKNKIKNICIFTIILSSFLFNNIYASTNTEIRTKDDLKIWDDIEVTKSVQSAVLATPKVNEEEKIYDFAELLTTEEEKKLYSKVKKFIDEYNIDMVIVTVKYNNKFGSQNYANDFYDYNYFGKNSTRDGIVFLIDKTYKHICIIPKGQAILIYNAEINNKIFDLIEYEIENAQYKDAISYFIYKAGDYIDNTETSYNKLENFKMTKKQKFGYNFMGILSLLINIFISFSFVYLFVDEHKKVHKAYRADDYFNKDSVKITAEKDICINSVTTKELIRNISTDDI